MPRFIVCFGGELQIAADSIPTYIGGRNRPVEVDGNITLEEFKRRLVRALHLDHVIYTVNIICRLRENGGYIATPITDDNIFEFILSEAIGRHVLLYVEPEVIRTTDEVGADFIELNFPETGTSSQIYRPTPVSADDIPTSRRYSVSDIGGLYPLAFVVVEAESNETLGWFLQQLHQLIPSVRERADLCFISDKHACIVRGCHEVFPTAAHRHCLRHLRENFKKAIRRLGFAEVDVVCSKMYCAGSMDDTYVFSRNMDDIQMIKKKTFDWLISRNVTRWTLLYDGGMRYGIMTTNASECFNGVLRRARGLPI